MCGVIAFVSLLVSVVTLTLYLWPKEQMHLERHHNRISHVFDSNEVSVSELKTDNVVGDEALLRHQLVLMVDAKQYPPQHQGLYYVSNTGGLAVPLQHHNYSMRINNYLPGQHLVIAETNKNARSSINSTTNNTKFWLNLYNVFGFSEYSTVNDDLTYFASAVPIHYNNLIYTGIYYSIYTNPFSNEKMEQLKGVTTPYEFTLPAFSLTQTSITCSKIYNTSTQTSFTLDFDCFDLGSYMYNIQLSVNEAKNKFVLIDMNTQKPMTLYEFAKSGNSPMNYAAAMGFLVAADFPDFGKRMKFV